MHAQDCGSPWDACDVLPKVTGPETHGRLSSREEQVAGRVPFRCDKWYRMALNPTHLQREYFCKTRKATHSLQSNALLDRSHDAKFNKSSATKNVEANHEPHQRMGSKTSASIYVCMYQVGGSQPWKTSAGESGGLCASPHYMYVGVSLTRAGQRPARFFFFFWFAKMT